MNDRTIQEARDEGFDDSRQADICDTCEYNSLDWHEEPCESCTGADNHWKPPTQTNTFKALEALDCISRAAAIDAADKIIVRDNSGNNDVVKAMIAWKEYIRGLPSAQPMPMRKRGKWITKSTNGEMFDCCSVCGYVEWDNPKNFCPNCGADMRERGEDDER